MLAAFDEQMRRRPVAGPGMTVEVEDRLTRMVGTDASWAAVVWSDLTEAVADEVIAAEVARSNRPLEWKLYAHDRPADGRGVFHALVGHRAVLARDRGYRYLQVDAMPSSRPILQRMGFHPLAETTPWMHDSESDGAVPAGSLFPPGPDGDS